MANMKEVNKAIKRDFPNIEVEAIRGDGYVYFDSNYEIDSVYASPATTRTEDMVRFCIESVEWAISKK